MEIFLEHGPDRIQKLMIFLSKLIGDVYFHIKIKMDLDMGCSNPKWPQSLWFGEVLGPRARVLAHQ